MVGGGQFAERDALIAAGAQGCREGIGLFGGDLMIGQPLEHEDWLLDRARGLEGIVRHEVAQPGRGLAGGIELRGDAGPDGVALLFGEAGGVVDALPVLVHQDAAAGVGGSGQERDGFDLLVGGGHHGRNQAAFAVAGQADARAVHIGAGAEPGDHRPHIIGEIGAGGLGSAFASGGLADAAIVVAQDGDTAAAEGVGDLAEDLVARHDADATVALLGSAAADGDDHRHAGDAIGLGEGGGQFVAAAGGDVDLLGGVGGAHGGVVVDTAADRRVDGAGGAHDTHALAREQHDCGQAIGRRYDAHVGGGELEAGGIARLADRTDQRLCTGREEHVDGAELCAVRIHGHQRCVQDGRVHERQRAGLGPDALFGALGATDEIDVHAVTARLHGTGLHGRGTGICAWREDPHGEDARHHVLVRLDPLDARLPLHGQDAGDGGGAVGERLDPERVAVGAQIDVGDGCRGRCLCVGGWRDGDQQRARDQEQGGDDQSDPTVRGAYDEMEHDLIQAKVEGSAVRRR